MKKMVICWVILVVGLVGVLTYIGLTYEKSISEYKSIEADMVEAADVYITINEIDLVFDEKLIITDEKMREDNLIKNLNVEDDECTGYVEVKKSVNKTNYNAYIKCRNYTTEGYVNQK